MKLFFYVVTALISFAIFSAEQVTSLYQKITTPETYLSADATLFVNEYYKLNWEKGEANASYFFRWNDETWSKFSEPVYPPIAGWNELHYYAEDVLENRESEQKLNLYVDRTSPKINIIWRNLPKTWNDQFMVQANNELTLRALDDESGVRNLYISLDGGIENSIETGEDWTMTTKEEGKHHISAFAYDNVKNISKRIELSWVVDSTPPSVSVNSLPKLMTSNDKSICARNTKLEITAKDNFSEAKDLYWRKSGTENWNLTERIFEIEKLFPYEKTIQIEFKAKDFSGNESLPLAFTCDIDRIAPETMIKVQK